MATDTLPVKKAESLFDEIGRIEKRIMQRAYEIFDNNGHSFGKELENWLQAEKELFWKPEIELVEKEGEFLLKVAVPGVDAKDLDVEVTAEELVVKGESKHEREDKKGKVHTSEFRAGSIFRAIRFPKKVDSDKVKGEFKNGVLTIKAPIVEGEQMKKIAVEATA